MTPVAPVVPMLRAPGRAGTGNTDHQVRPWGNSPVGRPCCGTPVDHDTWTVIPAHLARNRCVNCERETAL